MFRNKLPELAKEHNVENAFQLSKLLNVAASTTNRLWKGEFDKVSIDTMHKICEAFNCQISDFLEWDGQHHHLAHGF
jgi:DNA-binding Xre family transcriptional regulator